MTHWLMERAHEEGIRPVDVVLTSAQNKSAIKDLMEKIEQYRKGRDVYVVGVTNVGKIDPHQCDHPRNHWRQGYHYNLSLPRNDTGQDRNPTGRWFLHLRYTRIIHRHQMAHYLTAKNLKYVSPKKGNQAQDLSAQPRANPSSWVVWDALTLSRGKQGFTAFFDNELSFTEPSSKERPPL